MANMKLHAFLSNFRTAKVLATARLGGLQVELHQPDAAFLKSKAFTEASPLQKLPLLETSTGALWESNAIVRYLARIGQSTLYAGAPEELAEIDTWLDACQWDLEVALSAWLGPVLGQVEFSEEMQSASEAEVRKMLFALEAKLKGRRFLVGDRLTLADVAFCSALAPAYRLVFDEKFRKPFVNTNKWFVLVAGELVPELGKFTLCVQGLKAESKKGKKDKKDKKDKKKKEKDEEGAEKPKKDKKKKDKKKEEESSEEETKGEEGAEKPKKKKDKKKKEEGSEEETKGEEGAEKPKKDKKKKDKKKEEGSEEETKGEEGAEKPKKDKKKKDKKKKEEGSEEETKGEEGAEKPKKDKKKDKKKEEGSEEVKESAEKPKKEKVSKVVEEDEEVHVPRKANPLDALPPSSFLLDDWKRLYANTKQKREVMSQFWPQFDNEGWSLWLLHYQKAEGEGEEVYKTNNLLEGFLSRMDHFRRYCFGVMGVYGDEPTLEIKGALLWRGQEVPQELLDHPSFEYYTRVRVDPGSPELRGKVEDYWSNNTLDSDQVEGMTVRNWRSFL